MIESVYIEFRDEETAENCSRPESVDVENGCVIVRFNNSIVAYPLDRVKSIVTQLDNSEEQYED